MLAKSIVVVDAVEEAENDIKHGSSEVCCFNFSF
jgi:hypothetical protein